MSSAPRLKPWMWKAAIPVAVIAGMIIAWFYADAKAQRELEAARAGFAAHGFPTKLEEILPPSVPDDENAEPLLREAWKIVSGSTSWDSRPTGIFRDLEELELYSPPQSGGHREIVPEALAKLTRLTAEPEFGKFRAQVHLIAEKRCLDLHLEYSKGPGLLIPQVGPLRKMIQFLALDSKVLAESPSNPAGAWENLRIATILADRVDDTPTLISYLTAIAGRGLVKTEAVALLESGSEPPQWNAIVEAQTRGLEGIPSAFANAVHAERIVLLGYLERWLTTRSDWLHDLNRFLDLDRWIKFCDPWLTPIISAVGRPHLKREVGACLKRHFEIAEAIKNETSAMVPRLREVADRIKTSEEQLPKLLLPTLSGLSARHLQHLTEQRAFLALLSAFRHRQAEGRWPDDLKSLGLPNEWMIDACSGSPLVLKIESGTIVIYGFGFDGDDDGGREIDRSAKPSTDDGDIVVRVKLPTAKPE